MIGQTVSRSDAFTALLERYGADLSKLRGPRGVIACVFPDHPDRRASLSVDLDRALFNCFSCGRGGGLLRLRELLGEADPRDGRPIRQETEAQRVRRRQAAEQRAAAARRTEILPLWVTSDAVRRCFRVAQSVRGLAHSWGPEHSATWPALERAARLEVQGFDLEAAIDYASRRSA